MTASYPSATPTLLGLYDARNNVLVELSAPADAVQTTLDLLDTSTLPNSGYVTFTDNNEVVFYTAKTPTQLTGVTRGADGTTAAAHASGAFLEMRWNADYHNRQNEEVVAIATDLRDTFTIAPDDSATVADVAADVKDRSDMFATRIKEIISGAGGDWKDAITRPLNAVEADVLTRVLKAGDTMTGDLVFATNAEGVDLRDSGGTNGARIVAPASISAPYVLTVPTAQGAANTLFLNDGAGALSFGLIANANIGASAGIEFSKMEPIADTNLLIGNGSSVLVAVTQTGDVSISNTGVFAITADSIVDADINSVAAISFSKLAALTANRLVASDGSGFIEALGWTRAGDNLTGPLGASISLSGVTSGAITIAAADITTSYSIKWPAAQAGVNEFLQNDGSGNLVWAAPAGSGTVNSGNQFEIAHYPANGDTVDGLSTFVTDASGNLAQTATLVASPLVNSINNQDNTDPGSHAVFRAFTGGASGGDPYIRFDVVGAASWSLGIDNSASDVFAVAESTDLGSAQRFKIETGGRSLFKSPSSGVNNVFGIEDSGGSVVWNFEYTDASGQLELNPAGAFPMSLTAPGLFISRAVGGGEVNLEVFNSSNTASSDATIELFSGGTSAGDPYFRWGVAGAQNWSMGIRNNDNDDLKIARGIGLGGTVHMTFNTVGTAQVRFTDGTESSPAMTFISEVGSGMYRQGAGNLAFSVLGNRKIDLTGNVFNPVGGGNQNLGDAVNYWNDVSYKTLTDRGCLGWFDEGVEMQDGSVVSDLECFTKLEKDLVRSTIYGKPMIKYSSFPKVAYQKAWVYEYDENGKAVGKRFLSRDADGYAIGGEDGVEMTSMFSIMMGAHKETFYRFKGHEERIAVLEKQLALLKQEAA